MSVLIAANPWIPSEDYLLWAILILPLLLVVPTVVWLRRPKGETQMGWVRAITTGVVLYLSVGGSMLHQAGPTFKAQGWSLPQFRDWRLWEWYIEDAAISFAFSRNWAMGDGLVAFIGGERIEGYSNPLWVALMAFWEWSLGVTGFVSSKWMAMVFGALTVWMVWRIAVEALDDEHSWAPLTAPVLLALYPQFAFWNASGLENSLFNLMLAGGVWRTLVEARRGGIPWSSVFFLGLAVTRPEAIMYAAWGGFLGMVFSLRAGRGLKPTITWLLMFFLPFISYHVVRYDYFAYLFPNTYYAKLGAKKFRPFAWNTAGWKYVKNWLFDTGSYVVAPTVLLGVVGTRSFRKWAYLALLVLATGLFIYPKTDLLTNNLSWWPRDLPVPDDFDEYRVWGLLAVGLLAPLCSVGGRAWRARVLVWGMALISLFFCIRSGGDWMKGFRWLSFVSVPLPVLMAIAIDDLAGGTDALLRRVFKRSSPRWSWAAGLVAVAVTASAAPYWLMHSDWFFGKRETGPFSVQNRVNYSDKIINRIGKEGYVVNLDVDMGAHLYWSKHKMVDMAGLVDVSIAHHDFGDRAFMREYVFDEENPDFAHVHGGWASNSRIPTYVEWKSRYIEVPGYPAGRTAYHIGNHIRRDLFLRNKWRLGRVHRVPFDDRWVLAGFDVPSPEVSVGKSFYVEVAVQNLDPKRAPKARVLGFLSNDEGAVHTFDVALNYDWFEPTEWMASEIFVGNYTVVLPRTLEPGTYDLGFVLFDETGAIVPAGSEIMNSEGELQRPTLPADAVVAGLNGVEPRFAKGEVRFADVLVIGESGTGERQAQADFDRALAHIKTGDCDRAETAFRLARHHLPKATGWHDEHRETIAPELARCWALVAAEKVNAFDAIAPLRRGRAWQHNQRDLVAVQEQIGALLYEEGLAYRESRDWESAFDAFLGAVQAQPYLAWARRYAEEARDYRMGIDPESEARREAEREERRRASEARAEERRREQEARDAEAPAEPDAPVARPVRPDGGDEE